MSTTTLTLLDTMALDTQLHALQVRAGTYGTQALHALDGLEESARRCDLALDCLQDAAGAVREDPLAEAPIAQLHSLAQQVQQLATRLVEASTHARQCSQFGRQARAQHDARRQELERIAGDAQPYDESTVNPDHDEAC